ncbi:MAG: hypothetical protein KJZ62_07945 [Fimbriimonadaceae bacterium]|nr:hypothetical protein [Fimbriimonadaceae bacterium]QOJ10600.1 MAG: hypothetical protein HRU74_00475 [Chthonomonadaceae bacterium]
MDDKLKRFLDSHDDRRWAVIVKKLTYEAIRMMARHGFGGGNYAERAFDYALAAVSEAFARCTKDSSTRFDTERGDLTKPVDERFWKYLVMNCLRPFITRDAEKWVSRSRWPQVPLEEAAAIEGPGPDAAEQDAREIVTSLVEAADGDLKRLLIAARDQFHDDPDRSEVNWKALQEQLGITRYRCDALRKELDSLRTQVINAKGKPFLSTK